MGGGYVDKAMGSLSPNCDYRDHGGHVCRCVEVRLFVGTRLLLLAINIYNKGKQ